MKRTYLTWIVAAAGVTLAAAGFAAAAERGDPFTLTPDAHGMVLKTPDGRVVFSYMTQKPAPTNLTANSVCCLYPVNTPSGVRAVDFAPGDHRHHRGVFLAWHAMQCGAKRADFWGWGEMAPTTDRVIRNRDVKLVEADAKHARLAIRNDWIVEGETAIEEALAIEVKEQDGHFVIDMLFELTPQVDVTLDRTAFGGFCVKGRKGTKAAYTDSDGEVKLPKPHYLKPESDWPVRPWYDYTVALNGGKIVGVTVIDHPKNPPSTWHNLEPIAMVNPCIVAEGPVTLTANGTLPLRYRLLIHDGPAPKALIERLAAEFGKP
ncbi:MAG: DUF6807 family protein [Pirellulales bacterium]